MLCYYYFSVRSKADTSQLNLLHGKLLQALAVKTASEMTYIVSSGALNSTATNEPKASSSHATCMAGVQGYEDSARPRHVACRYGRPS